ncbi:MAG: hypothetical protein KatS3mg128_0344 [Silanimonas sp.]|nr:MAG: hypothetical protein KatS3mg128_0344 [Silanimonas sp.]
MNDRSRFVHSLFKTPFSAGVVSFCLGVLIAYGVGLWQRFSALEAQAEVHAAAIAAKDGELAAALEQTKEARREAAAADARARLVQVRLGLFQALNDLDQRNFGVASDRLREAASHFDGIDAEAVGLDPSVLSALRSEIQGTEVLVATDFESQRLRLIELAARVEAQTAAAFRPKGG